MTNTGKDAASFFENGTTEQFEYCYNMYPQVLKIKAEKRSKKPQELIRLDDWYQNKLPKLIKERGRNAHIEYEELVQTMKWKQTRGKFYPQLSYLIKVNTPRAVLTETKKAFRKLPNLEQAITALSNLKGVGTTMASALLAAASPDLAPFMADECLMAIPEIEGIDYTTKEYLNFVQHMQATVQRLNAEAGGEKPFWSPHRVELALWAHQVANDLSPELLEKMPTGKGGGGGGGGVGVGKANGNTAANRTLNDGISDDTNDGENERAAFQSPRRNVGLIGGGLSEPDTENENTNPITQDGDSNFVSNDSTSHEPIIDENTTQTTATTTTDEGEGDVDAGAGTPLASDSESNIEPPLVVQHSSISNTNHGKSKEADNSSTSAVNGNGTATVVAAPTDGDNSNCLRESEYEDESSSNSNTPRNHATITPLINHLDTSIANTDTTESTLSGCAAPKRAHNFNDGSINSLLENEVQPDLKKRRSD